MVPGLRKNILLILYNMRANTSLRYIRIYIAEAPCLAPLPFSHAIPLLGSALYHKSPVLVPLFLID
jgi:hypothetical protein